MTLPGEGFGFPESPETISSDPVIRAPEEQVHQVQAVDLDFVVERTRPLGRNFHGIPINVSYEDLVQYEKERTERLRRVPDPTASPSYTAPGLPKRSSALEDEFQPVPVVPSPIRHEESVRLQAAKDAVTALMIQGGFAHYPGPLRDPAPYDGKTYHY